MNITQRSDPLAGNMSRWIAMVCLITALAIRLLRLIAAPTACLNAFASKERSHKNGLAKREDTEQRQAKDTQRRWLGHNSGRLQLERSLFVSPFGKGVDQIR